MTDGVLQLLLFWQTLKAPESRSQEGARGVVEKSRGMLGTPGLGRGFANPPQVCSIVKGLKELVLLRPLIDNLGWGLQIWG